MFGIHEVFQHFRLAVHSAGEGGGGEDELGTLSEYERIFTPYDWSRR